MGSLFRFVVSKVKPPPNLPGPSSNNTKQRLNSDKVGYYFSSVCILTFL